MPFRERDEVGYMSDSKDQERKAPLKLSSPGKLELKKTVETGQVRQSFSHGRSKVVTVEVRKKRTFAPGAGGAMHEVRDEAHGVAEAELAKAVAVVEAAQQAASAHDLTNNEKVARAKALEAALKAEAEARARAEEEAARRAEEEAAAAAAAAAEAEAEPEEVAPVAEPAAEAAPEPAAAPTVAATPTAVAAPAPTPALPPRRPSPPSAPRSAHDRAAAGQAGPMPGARSPPPPPPPPRPPRPRTRRSAPEEGGAARPAGQGADQRRRTGKLDHHRRADRRRSRRARPVAGRCQARPRTRTPEDDAKGAEKVVRDVIIPETITVQELANRMAARGGDVISA